MTTLTHTVSATKGIDCNVKRAHQLTVIVYSVLGLRDLAVHDFSTPL